MVYGSIELGKKVSNPFFEVTLENGDGKMALIGLASAIGHIWGSSEIGTKAYKKLGGTDIHSWARAPFEHANIRPNTAQRIIKHGSAALCGAAFIAASQILAHAEVSALKAFGIAAQPTEKTEQITKPAAPSPAQP